MAGIEKVKQAIVQGDILGAGDGTEEALKQGTAVQDLLEKGMLAAIREVGDLWSKGRYFLPEVVMSSEAFKEAVSRLGPSLESVAERSAGKVVIGTVEGDLHDLGKNIVAAMLQGAGYEVVDLGVDVTAGRFVEKTREIRPHIVGIGAYMSTTMRAIPEVIRALDAEGLRPAVRIMVGGIPVTPRFAREAGADAYGEDAFEAVAETHRLMGRERP